MSHIRGRRESKENKGEKKGRKGNKGKERKTKKNEKCMCVLDIYYLPCLGLWVSIEHIPFNPLRVL